jgi:hypothetical protein
VIGPGTERGVLVDEAAQRRRQIDHELSLSVRSHCGMPVAR